MKSSGKVGSLTWFHSEDGRSHEFVIPSIGPDAKLDFTWQGEPIGSTDSGKRSVVVPRSDVLSVLSVEPGNDGQKKIEVHFVKNEEEPTGLGEPLFPPVFAAVANALYKATGKRYYDQPFAKQIETNPARM